MKKAEEKEPTPREIMKLVVEGFAVVKDVLVRMDSDLKDVHGSLTGIERKLSGD